MKRFSIVQNGYDVNEVNKFIDVVINRLEKFSNENNEYLREIESLKKKVNDNSNNIKSESTNTLLMVQEASDRIRTLAREEANMIIEEAKRNANSIVHEALVTAQKTENEANVLKKNIAVYKSRLKAQSETLVELIKDIEEDEL